MQRSLSYYTQKNGQTELARLLGVILKFFIGNRPEMWEKYVMGIKVTDQNDSRCGVRHELFVALCHNWNVSSPVKS